jgi:macrolide transport system ATP-binding/permease protein
MRMEHWWFTARLRLKSLLLRNRVEREMDEELRFHLENKIEEGMANGLSPKEARHAAMRAMGGLEQKKEQMRDARRIHWLTDFFDDVRYACRSLRRTSGFAAFVVLTLALGVGVTSGVFSMVDALIFRPYPVPHASGVVSLVSTTQDSSYEDFSYREYLDIRDKTKSYDGVIANAAMEAVAVVPVMFLVTMLAAFVPARKASQIAPTQALRYE